MSDNPLRDFLRTVARKVAPQPLAVMDVGADDVATQPPGVYSPFLSDDVITRSAQRVATTLENDLTLTIFSALSATVLITGMVKRPNGETQPIGPNGAGFFIAVIGDRVPRTITFPRGSGVDVIGLSIAIVSASPRVPVGACWAIVQQSRALPDGTQVITGTLVSGPVTQQQALGWPGSPVVASTSTAFTRTITGTNPAAGANIAEFVPTGARWEMLSFLFQLITAGGGPTRTPFFIMGGTTNVFTTNAQAGGTSCFYEFGQGIALAVSASGLATTPTPIGQNLEAGSLINTNVVGIQAGDVINTVLYRVNERLDP